MRGSSYAFNWKLIWRHFYMYDFIFSGSVTSHVPGMKVDIMPSDCLIRLVLEALRNRLSKSTQRVSRIETSFSSSGDHEAYMIACLAHAVLNSLKSTCILECSRKFSIFLLQGPSLQSCLWAWQPSPWPSDWRKHGVLHERQRSGIGLLLSRSGWKDNTWPCSPACVCVWLPCMTLDLIAFWALISFITFYFFMFFFSCPSFLLAQREPWGLSENPVVKVTMNWNQLYLVWWL